MEKSIARIKLKHYWIVAFILGSVAMYLMLSYSQRLSTGKYILLADDALEIYIANLRMYAKNILHRETIWYSFASYLGMNTSLGLAKQMFCPLNLLYIVFYKADVNVITAVIIIIKTGLAAAAFQLFVSKALKIRNYYSVLFAVFYSLCSFAVLYGTVHFMWLDGMYVLPVVALATYKAVNEGKYALLSATYAYIFIVQYYQGFLMLIFGLMYFALVLCLLRRNKGNCPSWKHVVKYICSVAIAVLISAFLLLPVFLFLRSDPSFRLSFDGKETTLMQVFNNLFWGEEQNFSLAPYVYCGIPVLLMFPFYFMNKKIPVKERIVYGVLLAFFSVACFVSPLLAFLHAFEKVEMWNFRFAFIPAFILCCIASKQAVYIKHIRPKSILIYCVFLILFFITEGRLESLEIGGISNNSLLVLAVNFGFAVLWIGLVILYIKKTKYRLTLGVLFLFLAMFETISNGSFCLSDKEYRSMVEREEYYYLWTEDMDYVVNGLDSIEGKNFYRMVVTGDYLYNSDSFCGYNGLIDYGTSGNDKTINFLKDMGLYVKNNRVSSTGITPTLGMLLSVKYNIRLHTEMEQLGYDTKPDIEENPDILPIAFMAEDEILTDAEMTNNVFENQNRIFKQLSGLDDLFIPVTDELRTTDEDGLQLSKEDMPIISSTDTNSGLIVFRVSQTNHPVYMQIASSFMPEDEQGIYYDRIDNMSFTEDSYAWIPFAAKLWMSGDNHYLPLRSNEGSSVNFPTDGIYVYELNTDRMREIEESLKKESFQPEIVKNGYLKGSVSVSDDKRVLFTSVPYEEGWKAFVNNQEIKCVPVLNGTFLGIVLPDKGEFEIELKYQCPGTRIGRILTLFGCLLLTILFIFERRIKKSKAKVQQ